MPVEATEYLSTQERDLEYARMFAVQFSAQEFGPFEVALLKLLLQLLNLLERLFRTHGGMLWRLHRQVFQLARKRRAGGGRLG